MTITWEQEISQPSVTKIGFNITCLKFHSMGSTYYWYHMLTSCYNSQPVPGGRCCTPPVVSVPARGPDVSYCYEYNYWVLLCAYSILHKPVHNVSHRIWPGSLKARFMGPTWAHLGPTGPRWAPCWPHELCHLGFFVIYFVVLWLCCESLVNPYIHWYPLGLLHWQRSNPEWYG